MKKPKPYSTPSTITLKINKHMSATEIQLPAPIQGKFNIALTQSNFQKLADKAATLVYNEDNLEEIKKFLDDMRKVDKAIEETHKEGKADALKIGRDWDAGKNSFLAMTSNIKSKPQAEYTKICQAIDKRRQDQQLEAQRIQNIKSGIESNAIRFATDIANCTTSEQLLSVERLINLEKGRKDKYMEFADEAIARYSELNALLKTQKETVRVLEENARQQEEAKKAQNDELLLKLQEEQAQVENKVEEAKIVVQETAIAQSINAPIQVAQEVIPEVKARRTTWKFEVVNEKEVMKKAPELVVFSIDEEKVKGVLKNLKDTHVLDGKTEYTLNGIKYFEQKTF
jgi:hypothetical protein